MVDKLEMFHSMSQHPILLFVQARQAESIIRRVLWKNYKGIPSQCDAMKKDCVISRIEASQDWSPYIYVTSADPNDYKSGANIWLRHYYPGSNPMW
jgi:hypothetical protein